jgi:[protein-PII] uridylyltransferase
VNIVTWDRAGLFYRLAGAFSVAGLNILSAKINTRNDHIAIDAFDVVEPNRGLVQSKSVMETFRKTVEQALVHNRDLLPDIQAQARKHRSAFLQDKTLPHSFTPHVDVYNELSMKRTILEIQAPDQIGLLYRLSRTIFDQGFDISFARINTERGIAIDTFYIEPANKLQTVGTSELIQLRDAIAEVVSTPESARAQA